MSHLLQRDELTWSEGNTKRAIVENAFKKSLLRTKSIIPHFYAKKMPT